MGDWQEMTSTGFGRDVRDFLSANPVTPCVQEDTGGLSKDTIAYLNNRGSLTEAARRIQLTGPPEDPFYNLGCLAVDTSRQGGDLPS